MTDAQELRNAAAVLRNTKPTQSDDWRKLCLNAADILVRQASFVEAVTKERAELILALDQNKQAVLAGKQPLELEIQNLQRQLAEINHLLFVERIKNKKQGQ